MASEDTSTLNAPTLNPSLNIIQSGTLAGVGGGEGREGVVAEAPRTSIDPRSATRQERARALFAKYGLTLGDDEWMNSPRVPVERVEKPIRMRVRRQCHRCQTTFGADKICSNCEHRRCKKCPRYPPRKSRQEKEAVRLGVDDGSTGDGQGIGITDALKPKERIRSHLLTIPSKTGGEDLIHRYIVQRVRRHCHECGTMFVRKSTQCNQCLHVRCKLCPREPVKLGKYRDGYPGDRDPEPPSPIYQWKKPRIRVRWTCHECSTLYMAGSQTCHSCHHERCSSCIRDPPKRARSPIDPGVLRRVEARLARLSVRRSEAEESTMV